MSCRHPLCPMDGCTADPNSIWIWAVDIHHEVDGGYEHTALFQSWESANAYRRAEGYRPFPWYDEHGFHEDVWYKPVYEIWDDLEEEDEDGDLPPGGIGLESAAIYMIEVKS